GEAPGSLEHHAAEHRADVVVGAHQPSVSGDGEKRADVFGEHHERRVREAIAVALACGGDAVDEGVDLRLECGAVGVVVDPHEGLYGDELDPAISGGGHCNAPGPPLLYAADTRQAHRRCRGNAAAAAWTRALRRVSLLPRATIRRA